jgi:MOSC domain-containing protein YiiM
MPASVTAIYISPSATVLPQAVIEVEARAHRGLVGDRYFEGVGTFSDWEPKGPGRELTLIESEVLTEIGLSAAEARRNIVTEGLRLNDLVGKRFRIGTVLIEGIRLCPPCAHLDKVTGKALLKPLADRGGLRADILSDGVIRVGDAITPEPETPMNESITTLEADLAREDHAADTLRLLDAYSADPMGDGHPLSDAAHRDLIPGLRQHPTTHVFLAYANGEAVGLAICFLGFSTFAARRLLYIMDYFVQPTHRGRGIGKRLMDSIAARGRELGCCRLTLEVQENNRHARRIYTAAGFEQAVYVPEAGGALCMHKPL